MKKFLKVSSIFVLAIVFMLGLSGPIATKAVGSTTTVNLGSTSTFAILAGTPDITDAGNFSTITGNVGLSPATGAGIGLLSSQVTGTIYAVDGAGPAGSVNNPSLLTTAKNDLKNAYDDASGRGLGTTIATELGGQTLTSGVYSSASTTFQITAGSGALVLDGQNDPSSVFIFEMNSGSTGLIVGPGSTVSLINDASACNIFWRVNTATINTTAVFKGNILALTQITVANGATIEGRLLARNANVTLDDDVIDIPTCAAPTTASLHIIKTVVNDNSGTAVASSFNLHAKLAGVDVTGSPASGTTSPGTLYSLTTAGTYVISEDANTSYAQSFSGDCDSSGNVTLAMGDNKTCTITNNDIASTSTTTTPGLPNTGFASQEKGIFWGIIALSGIIVISAVLFIVRKKKTS